jgi:hypothetical protein
MLPCRQQHWRPYIETGVWSISSTSHVHATQHTCDMGVTFALHELEDRHGVNTGNNH